MYSLLNVGRLYLVLGFISILVYLNIPDEMNQSTMAVWILGLSSIYFVLGIRRLIKHYRGGGKLSRLIDSRKDFLINLYI